MTTRALSRTFAVRIAAQGNRGGEDCTIITFERVQLSKTGGKHERGSQSHRDP